MHRNDENRRKLIFFSHASSLLAKSIDFLTISIGVAVITNIIANIFNLFIPKFMIEFFKYIILLIQGNLLLFFLFFLILILLRYIAYLGGRVPAPLSYKELEREYLSEIKLRGQTLVPTVSLEELHHKNLSARLDDIFVVPEFYLNQPLISQPTKEEVLKREHLQDEIIPWRYPRISQRISLNDLWAGLTRDCPGAVIQGYPGMGKSTLLASLALYMARCYSRRWSTYAEKTAERVDKWQIFSKLAPFLLEGHFKQSRLTLLRPIGPPLIPIIIDLKEYALPEHVKNSIFDY